MLKHEQIPKTIGAIEWPPLFASNPWVWARILTYILYVLQ